MSATDPHDRGQVFDRWYYYATITLLTALLCWALHHVFNPPPGRPTDRAEPVQVEPVENVGAMSASAPTHEDAHAEK